MPRDLDGYVRIRSLELFRFHGVDFNSATLQAAEELAELKRQRGIVDPPPAQSHVWTPPAGRLVGAQRNG